MTRYSEIFRSFIEALPNLYTVDGGKNTDLPELLLSDGEKPNHKGKTLVNCISDISILERFKQVINSVHRLKPSTL
ncbi:MAG: hypothetical protein WBA13_00480 [Microcoleaceae cyanobacterium]